jgi:hypothetical protein
MSNLNTFKAAVRTLSVGQTDYLLLASGVRFLRKAGLSEREIFRTALGLNDQLRQNIFEDEVKTALERHPK